MDILELIHIEAQHGQNKPHKCNMNNCGKAFGRRSDLVRHQRIHTNERPYKCEQMGCGKSFIQRSALKVHMRTHSGERPHTCEVKNCGKSFSDSSSLARHRRIHTGKRPYKCRMLGCNKQFARKTILTTHQKVAHGTTTKQRTILQWRPLNEPHHEKTPSSLYHASLNDMQEYEVTKGRFIPPLAIPSSPLSSIASSPHASLLSSPLSPMTTSPTNSSHHHPSPLLSPITPYPTSPESISTDLSSRSNSFDHSSMMYPSHHYRYDSGVSMSSSSYPTFSNDFHYFKPKDPTIFSLPGIHELHPLFNDSPHHSHHF
ncbi:unnamed protein product [Cunninghamella blakesleeana]